MPQRHFTRTGTAARILCVRRFGKIFGIRPSHKSLVRANRVYACTYTTLPDYDHNGQQGSFTESILFLSVVFRRGLEFVSSKNRNLIGCLRIDGSNTSDQLVARTVLELVDTNKTVEYENVKKTFGTKNVRTLIRDRMSNVVEVDLDTLRLEDYLEGSESKEEVDSDG